MAGINPLYLRGPSNEYYGPGKASKLSTSHIKKGEKNQVKLI